MKDNNISEPSDEELTIVEQYRIQVIKLQEENNKKGNELKELQSKYEEECKNANIQSEQMLKLNQELQRLRRSMNKVRKGAKSLAYQSDQFSLKDELSAAIWLSPDFNEQLKEVNDNFINELTQSLGTFITETPKDISDAFNEFTNNIKNVSIMPKEEATDKVDESINEVKLLLENEIEAIESKEISIKSQIGEEPEELENDSQSKEIADESNRDDEESKKESPAEIKMKEDLRINSFTYYFIPFYQVFFF